MRIGDRSIGRRRFPRCGTATGSRMPGFTYLWLLFAVAIAGAGLAVAGQGWHHAAQRERERELIFRGRAIAAAIGSYRSLGIDGGDHVGPSLLDELVTDDRGPHAVHHLRRLYADPFTGLPDWVLVLDAGQRVVGVHSRSNERAFITADLESVPHVGPWRVSDRVFVAGAGAPNVVRAAASAPSSPAP